MCGLLLLCLHSCEPCTGRITGPLNSHFLNAGPGALPLPPAPRHPGAAGPPVTSDGAAGRGPLRRSTATFFSYHHCFATKMIQNFSLFFQQRLSPPRIQNLFLTLKDSLLSMALHPRSQ